MDERYPIGRFDVPEEVDGAKLTAWLYEMEALPRLLNQTVMHLEDDQLQKTYREGSWTVKQVVHHIADSHMNSYIRMKLAVTENNPTVSTYEEQLWAELADYTLPVEVSLQLIASLHQRWLHFLRSLTKEQLQKKFVYLNGEAIQVKQAIGLYAWHGNHHLAHIKQAIS